MTSGRPLLELRGITKTFGGTHALQGVDLSVEAGTVHALIGENGAGKSTLMKVLSGAHRPDSGRIFIDGRWCEIRSPSDGLNHGVAMIYQELNLARHLSVEENLTLGCETSRFGFVRSRRREIRKILDLLHHPELPLDTPVSALSVGLQQIVEIGRALIREARIIVMDEPTSSLSATDTEALFSVIARLRDNGIAVIYISHFLEEVTAVADRFTVLRDGQVVDNGIMSETTIPKLIEFMVGRTLDEMFPRLDHTIGEPLLRVEGVQGDPVPKGVSFTLRRGEILGIAGLVGAGRSELLRALFGLGRVRKGEIYIDKADATQLEDMTPEKALRSSLDLLSENRKEEGLALDMSVAANTTLSDVARFAWGKGWGLVRLGQEAAAVEELIDRLAVRCSGPGQRVADLSGGNQQKVAFSRILLKGGDLVLLDEPTRGVDVGSKVEIYRIIGALAAQGKGVVMVSSYLPELLGICDTLAVMHRGRLSAIKPVSQWTEQEIMEIATSGNPVYGKAV